MIDPEIVKDARQVMRSTLPSAVRKAMKGVPKSLTGERRAEREAEVRDARRSLLEWNLLSEEELETLSVEEAIKRARERLG
jgi:hypothetical protein